MKIFQTPPASGLDNGVTKKSSQRTGFGVGSSAGKREDEYEDKYEKASAVTNDKNSHLPFQIRPGQATPDQSRPGQINIWRPASPSRSMDNIFLCSLCPDSLYRDYRDYRDPIYLVLGVRVDQFLHTKNNKNGKNKRIRIATAHAPAGAESTAVFSESQRQQRPH
ncbi:MAG: hypothetical protein AAGI24_08050 [Pseudomonadota bacterium]